MIQDISYTACAAPDSGPADLETLCRTYHPMLATRAKQYTQAPFSEKEMFNEAIFALWKASEAFNGSPLQDHIQFKAYAERCVCNHLNKIKRRYFRKEIAAKEFGPGGETETWASDVDAAMDHWTIEGLGIDAETLQSPAERAQTAEVHALLSIAISKLNEKQQAVIIQRFYYGRSLEEAGQLVGLSARSASVYEHRALETLRRHLPAEFAQHFHQGSN